MHPTREYYDNGRLGFECWRVENKLHRVDGPAVQHWYENGQLRYECWWVDDRLHRLDGPAIQHWYEDGKPISETWHIEGKKVVPISDPLAWALWIAKSFGNVHGIEKFCFDKLDKKIARAILASSKLL